MTLPSLSDSQKRNFSVTAQLLPPAKLEMPRSRNYVASLSPQYLSQCLLSALAKLPQNNTAQINIIPSFGQAASISFICQSLPVRASITTSLSSWSSSTWTGTPLSTPDPLDPDVELSRATQQRTSVPINLQSCLKLSIVFLPNRYKMVHSAA